VSYKSPGKMRSVAEFRAALRSIDPELDCDDTLLGAAGPFGRNFQLADREIGNRFAIHPMEGWDAQPDGLPSAHTLRRWRRFGESGAKLIWGGEAFAVCEDGRANPNQLFLNPRADSRAGLSALLTTLRAAHARENESTHDLLVGLQLTHSGRFARPTTAGAAPRIAFHHPVLEQRYPEAARLAPLTDAELESIADRFVDAARVAQDVGFDFVDVKCCHGYLLHELLAARTRPGPYGGSFENRTRLFQRIVAGIRRACPGLLIATRVSISDLAPFIRDPETRVGRPAERPLDTPYVWGFGVDPHDPLRADLDEPLAFLALLERLDVRLVNVTLGSPYYCPHVQRPAAYPPSDGYFPPEDPLRGVAAHLLTVRRCRRAFPNLALVGTGYSYLQEFLPHVAQHELAAGHVDFVGLGRMALSYPHLPRDLLRGAALDRKSICRTFSDCTTGPRNGMISGCFPLDDYYRQRSEAARVQQLRRAIRETPE